MTCLLCMKHCISDIGISLSKAEKYCQSAKEAESPPFEPSSPFRWDSPSPSPQRPVRSPSPPTHSRRRGTKLNWSKQPAPAARSSTPSPILVCSSSSQRSSHPRAGPASKSITLASDSDQSCYFPCSELSAHVLYST